METLIEMAKRDAYFTNLDKNYGWKQCLVYVFFYFLFKWFGYIVEDGACNNYSSGKTLNPRRHWNLDFNIPNVFSILTRVLLCARLNVVCGPGAANTNFELSCTSTTIIWGLYVHNATHPVVLLVLDSRYILASWTEPGHFASTFVIMWEASHI